MSATYQMAHIHVSLYDPKRSIPESNNHWLAKLVWKSNEKAGRQAHASRCLSIPVWQPKLAGEDRDFLDMLIEYVQEKQKQAAHAYVTKLLDEGKEATTIPSEVVNPATILSAWQEEQSASDESRGKLSGKEIKTWFKDQLEGLVIQAFAEKKGYSLETINEDQLKKLEQLSNGYAAMFEKLAAPKPDIKREVVESMVVVADLLPSDRLDFDPIFRKVKNKLDKMNKPEETISLEELL